VASGRGLSQRRILTACAGVRLLRRREFIATLGAAALPLTGYAQQPEGVRRVGLLNAFPENDPVNRASVMAFAGALERLGWVEGQNIRIDYRFAAGDPALFKTYAAELVGLSPDAILASNTPAVAAVRQQTRAIPIVFVRVSDPVGQGFVESLARPGGNITGFSVYDAPLMGKWVQLLKEVAPCVTRVAVIFNPDTRALRRVAQPRDRGRRPVSRDDGDICSGARRSGDRGHRRRVSARAGRWPDRFAGQF
jgi:ABC-type uncharacterized transport system substrate-binding protein